MDIIAAKILVAILFGAIRFVFGVIPIKLYVWLKLGKPNVINEGRRAKLEYGIAVVQAFGGGVMFATCFLHMMPEVYYSVEELKRYGDLNDEYPFSQLVISLGFFTIYFIEEISQWLMSRAPSMNYNDEDDSGNNKSTSTRKIAVHTPGMDVNKSKGSSKIFPKNANIPDGMAFEIPAKTTYILDINENNEKIEKKNLEQDNMSAEVILDNLDCPNVVDKQIQTENEKYLEMLNNMENNMDLDVNVNAKIDKIIEDKTKTQQQIMRCFLMITALSFHAIFEGLAIGLQQSQKNVWYLFTAVSIHSATILFCVGLEIVLSGTKAKTTIIHVTMLSGTSPFGVLLGLMITLTTDLHTGPKSFAIVLLLGLSAGTILYITFFETLSREKARRGCRLLRALSIGVGFTLMAFLESLKLSS